MWGNTSIGNDGGSEAWIPQQVCSDGRAAAGMHGSSRGGSSSSDGGSTPAASDTEDVAGAVHRALDTCRTNHQFIASQAEHLQRLRSQCATSAQITRQEIRALEVKLVRLFGQQLACKRRLPVCASLPAELHNFPCLTQWLSVVGLNADAVQAVCCRVNTLEALLALGEAGVATLLGPVTGTHSQAGKLTRALHNLRRYTASQMSGATPLPDCEPPLYWDSWEQQRGSCPSSPRTLHRPSPHTPHREARSSVSSSDGDTSETAGGGGAAVPGSGSASHHQHHQQPQQHHHHHPHHHHRNSDESSTPSSPPVPPPSPLHAAPPSLTLQLPPSSTPLHDLRYTPPTTPPVIKTPRATDKKVSTPPPNKRYLLINQASPANCAGSGSLGRSTSHDSQLANRRAALADAAADTGAVPSTGHQYTSNSSGQQYTSIASTGQQYTSTSAGTGGLQYTSSTASTGQQHYTSIASTGHQQYTNNSIYNSAGNSTTPPHNANDLLLVSPSSSAIMSARHQSESSSEPPPYMPFPSYDQSQSRSNPATYSPAPLTQAPPLSSLASPTRHYNHQQHSYQQQQHADDDNCNKNCVVPRSPRTPPLQGSMVHNVQHRFTKSINIKPATCGYCHQKFPILGAVFFAGLRCKECNYKCHKECEMYVPPSCGLPNEYLKIFTESFNCLQNSNRGGGGVGGVSPSHQPPDNLRTPPILPSLHHSQHSQHTFQGLDSSSNTSSCNSSTPSSPAPLILPPGSPAAPLSSSSSSNSGGGKQQQPRQQQQPPLSSSAASHLEAFHYPDVSKHRVSESWGNFPMRGPSAAPCSTPNTIHSLTSTNSSTLSAASTRSSSELADGDRGTLSNNSGSGSTDDSERTVAERVNSQDSADGQVESVESSTLEGPDPGGTDDSSGVTSSSLGEGCSRQNSVSHALREWDIPYDELDKGKIIGRGRFGTVYSGNWHGQVAIKELHMEYGNDQNTLEAFKSEVSMFRKTRHQNLVLFMGACMKLPRLAIITSLCKGSTLYKHIHVLRDKFTMTNTISIAQQVAQGMGYLHARGIVHKDLKTKNIFIENGKVVITDFGLVNVTRLCQNDRVGAWLSIPAGWLCYLSPELMRGLQVSAHQPYSLPYTTTTDVYAYGTVWFELLCGEWPHKGLPPEAIIWQVGRGMKPSLAHLQASRDVKDILMECWSYQPDDRPDFAVLQKQLKKLPKRRLARSPSHPIHLSRSAECVF